MPEKEQSEKNVTDLSTSGYEDKQWIVIKRFLFFLLFGFAGIFSLFFYWSLWKPDQFI